MIAKDLNQLLIYDTFIISVYCSKLSCSLIIILSKLVENKIGEVIKNFAFFISVCFTIMFKNNEFLVRHICISIPLLFLSKVLN